MRKERFEQLFQMFKMFERWEISILYMGKYRDARGSYLFVPEEAKELAMEDLRVMIGAEEFNMFKENYLQNEQTNTK